MSEQLKAGVAAAIQVLAEDHGATIEAVTSQADLMALGCVVADASAVERTAPSLDIVGGVLVLLLEEAADSLEEHPEARTVPNRAVAARAALGLYPGTQGKPLRGRRGSPGRLGTIAEWLGYQPDSMFNPRQDGRSPFGALVEDMAEYVVRREIAHLVSEQRLAQQARRPPLESAMRVDWLPRFERYYAMWSYVAGIRYDVELAVAGKRDNNAVELDYFARKSLWYYGCFVRELEDFTRKEGGLWIMPDSAAEQMIADAVWMLRKPTPLTELDESLLRIAAVGWDEMAIFIQATHADSALRGLAERWRTWIESCDCSNLKRPRKQCVVHQCTRWAAVFMDALNQQWDLLADWYDVPRPASAVTPSGGLLPCVRSFSVLEGQCEHGDAVGMVVAVLAQPPYWNVISGATLPECQAEVYCDVIVPGCLGRKAGSMSASPAFQLALGQAVKARREELGLTQEQLDNNTELHQRWISNVETGKRNPSIGSLRRLAAGLDLTASELLARAEQIEASGIETINAAAH